MDNPTMTHNSSDAARMNVSSSGHPSASHWRSAESARDVVDRTRTLAHEAVDRLASGASGWVDRMEGRGQGLSDVPLRAWDYSRSTVKNHPVATVALAVLAGYMVVRLLDLRRP
jgi:hypothetical protein